MFVIQLLLLLISIQEVLTSNVERPRTVVLENLTLKEFAETENESTNLEKKEKDKNPIIGIKHQVQEIKSRHFRPDTPTNIMMRYVFNKRGFFLAEGRNGTIYGNRQKSENTVFRILVYSRVTVRLQNMESNDYVAISCATGKVYATSQLDDESFLVYKDGHDSWYRFRSLDCPRTQQLSHSWYLGIRKDGTYKNASQTKYNDKGSKFQLKPI